MKKYSALFIISILILICAIIGFNYFKNKPDDGLLDASSLLTQKVTGPPFSKTINTQTMMSNLKKCMETCESTRKKAAIQYLKTFDELQGRDLKLVASSVYDAVKSILEVDSQDPEERSHYLVNSITTVATSIQFEASETKSEIELKVEEAITKFRKQFPDSDKGAAAAAQWLLFRKAPKEKFLSEVEECLRINPSNTWCNWAKEYQLN